MPNDVEKIKALEKIFTGLGVPDRSGIRIAGQLCGIAATLDRLECHTDSNETLHILVNGIEAFQCNVEGGRGNFRNLLAMMWMFAQQFADPTLTPELSAYKLNCIIKPPEEGGACVRLETINTASEQRFSFSKI